MTKHLLSGNEAIARGAYEAGVKVCSAYPGTPSIIYQKCDTSTCETNITL